MRATAVLLLAITLARAGPEAHDPAVAAQRARRAALRKTLDRDYALLIGQPLTDVLHPRQEGDFLYLTGVRDANALLLLAGAKARPLKASNRQVREIVLLRDGGNRYAQFYGLEYRPGEAAERALGVELTLAAPARAAALGELVAKLLPRSARLRIPPYRGRDHALVREVKKGLLATLQRSRRDVKVVDLSEALRRQRVIKDAYEIGLLTRAIAITHEAFRVAAPHIFPGSTEYAVDGALLGAVRKAGARPAYPFVVGSGKNSTFPHYFRNEDPLRDGDLLVIDAGAAYRRYAADITRTFPVNGKFTPRQRECYEIVLTAQLAAIKMVRPGVSFRQVHAAARQVIAKAGLGKYFIHRTSHHVGLDVHDPGPVQIQQGMTLTVEPGVYIPEERIGIRIEDIVLVTEKGSRILGEPFPKTVDEIEAFLAGR